MYTFTWKNGQHYLAYSAQVLLDGSIHLFFYVVEYWQRFSIDSEDKNYV